jgi:hypothetical protein
MQNRKKLIISGPQLKLQFIINVLLHSKFVVLVVLVLLISGRPMFAQQFQIKRKLLPAGWEAISDQSQRYPGEVLLIQTGDWACHLVKVE